MSVLTNQFLAQAVYVFACTPMQTSQAYASPHAGEIVEAPQHI